MISCSAQQDLKIKKRNDDHIKFGCYIYQDGLKYKDIVDIALQCEKLGYNSIWLKDNFIPCISAKWLLMLDPRIKALEASKGR